MTLLRPTRGERRPPGELVEIDSPAHAQVVVAGQADRRVGGDQGHTRVGVGAVADQIAQAPDLLALARGDLLEHRLERVLVAVDVRDHRDAHLYSLSGEPDLERSQCRGAARRGPRRASSRPGCSGLAGCRREPLQLLWRSTSAPQEIARGRAFARPQRAIGLAGTAVDAALLLLLTRRPARTLDRVRPARWAVPWPAPACP